jgi:hypothetical protein
MKKYLTTKVHKVFKSIFYILGGVLAIGTCIPAISLGQQFSDTEFPYDINSTTQLQGTDETTNLADVVKQDTVNPTTSILKRLTDFFRLSGTSYDNPDSTSKATDYIKWILNVLLGLVSFLSLVMIIFAFYLIFFSKGEDGVGKAKKILIGVGIALAIM